MKYIVLLILIIFLSNFVFSIGLAPSKYRMEVQPNNQYIIMYSVMGVSNFEPIVGSDPLLKKYIKVGEITTDERGVHHFPIIFDFPNEIDKQGHQSVSVTVKQKPLHEKRRGQIISGLTAVEGRIELDIPYKGLYAEMYVDVYNANQGEEVEFDIIMKNFGQEGISVSYVEIEIYKKDKKIKTLKSNKVNIPISKSHEFVEYLTTEDLKPGIYTAKITGYYDNKKREEEITFKIGTLDVLITNITKELYVNETNEFFIQIESLWNNNIEKVYADIKIIKDDKIVKEFPTPNYDLKPWSSKRIISYLDTRGWELGEYDLDIKLNFERQIRLHKDTMEVIERPKPEIPFNFFGLSTTGFVLITLTILMIIINGVLIMNIMKNRNIKKQEKKPKKKK